MAVKIETFDIELPGDLEEMPKNMDGKPDLAEWKRRMAEHAINQAREESEAYVMPCNWTATYISGEPYDFTVKFQVVRESKG